MCDSNGTLGICDAGSDGGMLMPFFGEDEQKWPTALRAILYLFGMVWCFLGVAIIADLFMEAIEQITSKVTITTDKVSGKKRVRRFWNPTVANLSLMALGSSAPEIMLNVMEIVVGGPKGPFHAGDLGPSTIVGSAAFNLLVISAVVVTAITEGTKKIEQMQVYAVTASCSVFAYVWLLIILIAVSPDIIELWEAILTFVFFWILLVVCYAADRNWFRSDKGKVAPMSKTIAQLPVDENGGKANGDTSSEKPKAGLKALGLARQATGALQGLSNNEQHALAKQTMEMLPPTSAVHRRNALHWLTGKKAKPVFKKMRTLTTEMIEKSIEATKNVGAIVRAKTQVLPGTEKEEKDASEIKFKEETVDVMENAGSALIVIIRTGNLSQPVTVEYSTHDIGAVAGKDYEETSGTCEFPAGVAEKTISVGIIDDDVFEKNEKFRIQLADPSEGAKLDEKSDQCVVTIINDDELKRNQFAVLEKFHNRDQCDTVMAAWKEQFTDAIKPPTDEEGSSPGVVGWILHIMVMPFKVTFATVPPVCAGGGWPAFFVALGYIAFMTILVGDLAGFFGCVIGCPPAVTAITFVALGTSMPDTFASKTAAQSDETADNSVGNITGSNCVNVFLGLGLPWSIGAIYWALASDDAVKEWEGMYSGEKNVKKWMDENEGKAAFVVLAGDLGLSVIVFCCCALVCLLGLYVRRVMFGGELGGPYGPRMGSAVFFVLLWGVYITVSSLKSMCKIDFEM